MAGITFKETMSGSLALHQNDPSSGSVAGNSVPLIMHGTITIDDMKQFLLDPDHQGKLDVRMDWAPLGIGIPSTFGVFKLFSPSTDPQLKLMVYEWRVEHAGRTFYFAGARSCAFIPYSICGKIRPLFSRLCTMGQTNSLP